MQTKTEGIILHSMKYSDKANIITVYTRQYGRTSFMVYRANKKKSSVRSALLQPLTLVEMNVSHVPGKELHSIKDLQIIYPFVGIPYNPIKNSIALFLSETLFRVLRQSDPDDNLFVFLENSIQQLDNIEDGISNFHLVFLMKLTRYLGFEPNKDQANYRYFDLMNGVFQYEKPLHSHFLSTEISSSFDLLLNTGYASMQNLHFSRQERIKLLEILVEYYRLHIPDFHGLQSLVVLQSLFD